MIRYRLNDEQLRRYAVDLEQMRDWRKPLAEIGRRMVQSTRKRFDEERGPDGAPWQRLAPSTLLKPRRSRFILRDAGMRGGLMRSITARSTRRSVYWGTNKVYGRIHQLGGKAGRGHAATIPARPYLGISQQDEAEIGRVVIKHIRLQGDREA